MSSNDALLPCPFCGARDHKPADEYTSRPYGGLINEENPDANCISCDNCLAHGPLCDETKGQDTIAAWNRRHAPPAPAAGEEALERMAEAAVAESESVFFINTIRERKVRRMLTKLRAAGDAP